MEASEPSKAPKIDVGQIDDLDWQTLSETLLSAMERFYEDPDNVERFNTWKKNKLKRRSKHD